MRYLFATIVFLLVVGCSQKPETPEEVVNAYVKALYEDADMEKAGTYFVAKFKAEWERELKEVKIKRPKEYEEVVHEFQQIADAGYEFTIIEKKIDTSVSETIEGNTVDGKAKIIARLTIKGGSNPGEGKLKFYLHRENGHWKLKRDPRESSVTLW